MQLKFDDVRSVVKLIKNWRSHPAILNYPNEQFYKGELEPHGDVVITHSLLRSHELVKPGFPIVFHALTGKDMREANSPSFFNTDEASQTKRFVDALRTDQRLKLKDEHIGVIAPYHAQVMKIRQLLRQSYSGVKVGSVEEFQGQVRNNFILEVLQRLMILIFRNAVSLSSAPSEVVLNSLITTSNTL